MAADDEPQTAPKRLNTHLTDYSIANSENEGPYSKELEVDALVVGAGFGK